MNKKGNMMSSKILSYETVNFQNTQFMQASIAIMYDEDNRNYTAFEKADIEKAIPSLFGIPVVGEFDEEGGAFKGHGGRLEMDDDGMRYIQTTKPYGFVPESATVSWKMIEEPSGKMREYLVVEPVVLWSGRYQELNLLSQGKVGQSMEILVNDGYDREDDFFQITDFEFSALCLLGVEPAFEGAHAKLYTKYTKEESYSQVEKEFKEIFAKYSKERGSDEMNFEKILEAIKNKYSATHKVEGLTIEDLETKLQGKEFTEETPVEEIFESLELEEIEVEPTVDYKAKFEELEADFNQLKADKETIETEYATLKDAKEALDGEYSTLKNDFTDLTNTVTAKDLEITDLTSKVEGLSEYANKYAEAVKEDVIENISGKINEYSSILSLNNEEVSEMVGKYVDSVEDFTDSQAMDSLLEKVETDVLVLVGRKYAKDNSIDKKGKNHKEFSRKDTKQKDTGSFDGIVGKYKG